MDLFGNSSLLRQSCDRCHKRKQRCTRSGAQDDKPCRRCKNDGEKCVYSPRMGSGRPKSRKTKEGKPRENEAKRRPGSFFLPTSCRSEMSDRILSVTTADPTFITNTTISAFPLQTTDSDTSHSSCTTAIASSTLPTVLDESVDSWWSSSNDCAADVSRSIITADSIYGTPTNIIDGSWSELLGCDWQSNPTSTFDSQKPCISARITDVDSGPEKPDHYHRNTIDPIPLLSQINMQLYQIEMPKAPQSSDWMNTLDRAVQTTQSFIQALNKLLPEGLARPAFFNIAHSFREDVSASSSESSRSHSQDNTSLSSPEKVDSIVLRLALICYIQVIRLFRGLIIMLTDTLIWAEMHPGEKLNLLPIRIGALHATVSPQLHVVMLVQLIAHHFNELCDKVRRVAARTIENKPQNEPDNSSTPLRDLIGIDVCSEEDNFRDGLHLIADKLRDLHFIPLL